MLHKDLIRLHSRRAATQVLDRLQRFPGAGLAVFHWFSGTARELERAASAGYWFSVGPAMLASTKGRALAAAMPRDRILTETDGPFARVDGAAALPWDCQLAVAGLADLWGQPREEIRRRLEQNLRRLTAAATA
jgi:TatD DNase family protein